MKSASYCYDYDSVQQSYSKSVQIDEKSFQQGECSSTTF